MSTWSVTDLLRRRVVAASTVGTDVMISHDQMSLFEAYYWLAPDAYLGSRYTIIPFTIFYNFISIISFFLISCMM